MPTECRSLLEHIYVYILAVYRPILLQKFLGLYKVVRVTGDPASRLVKQQEINVCHTPFYSWTHAVTRLEISPA